MSTADAREPLLCSDVSGGDAAAPREGPMALPDGRIHLLPSPGETRVQSACCGTGRNTQVRLTAKCTQTLHSKSNCALTTDLGVRALCVVLVLDDYVVALCKIPNEMLSEISNRRLRVLRVTLHACMKIPLR